MSVQEVDVPHVLDEWESEVDDLEFNLDDQWDYDDLFRHIGERIDSMRQNISFIRRYY